MPHSSVKLHPGVDVNRTPALNEAAISQSNLIRFVPDKGGLGLVQKLGGWTKFFSTSIGSYVRALWAWEDTNANTYLGVGAQATSIQGTSLSVIKSGTRSIITPQTTAANIPVSFTTTAGSSLVVVGATGSNLFSSDSIYLETQVSVGGLVLFGMYKCIYVSANAFEIVASDTLGNPLAATSSVTGGAVPVFAFQSGSYSVTVTLNNHGYMLGDTFPVLTSLTSSGITLYGNYVVENVIDANNFVIYASNTASSTASGIQLNGGNAAFVYYRTPSPLPTATGYGVGGYGVGGYGTGVAPVGASGTPIAANEWTVDNWGQIFLACPTGGNIYSWDPTSNIPIASVITNAPVVNDGMFTAMPQRQIVAWGSTFTGIQDPLLLRWCDVDDFTSWIAKITNQAGSYRIPKGSRIISALQGPQQGLVWTDLAVWSMQYVGPPYVYQFNEIGTGCGLIARKAAASMNGVIYWMGQSQFFMMGPTGVSPIACPIWDVAFQDLDASNTSKIRIAPNSRFGEITWYYPVVGGTGENTNYVKYNVNLQTWDYGALSRTAWINESVLGPPIGAGGDYNIYQHETSPDAAGSPMNSFFQTGYFVLQEGEWEAFVDQVWPDMKWGYYGGNQGANVLLTFYVVDYPGQAPRTYGPYTLTQTTTYITPRFRGRLVSIQIQSNDIGSFWRIGNLRYRVMPDGKFY
jgi:hypothetical protein